METYRGKSGIVTTDASIFAETYFQIGIRPLDYLRRLVHALFSANDSAFLRAPADLLSLLSDDDSLFSAITESNEAYRRCTGPWIRNI